MPRQRQLVPDSSSWILPLRVLPSSAALPGFTQYSRYFAISLLVSAPRNLPCVPLAVLHASILSLVISSSAAIVPLLWGKSVKCQHRWPWQKANSFRLLCSAVTVLWDACTSLARIAPVLHHRLRLPSLCIHAALWWRTFEAAPRRRRKRRRGRNFRRRSRLLSQNAGGIGQNA